MTRDAFDAGLARIRTEIADGRTENARQFGELRTENANIRTEIADGREESARQFGELRTENANIRAENAKQFGELRTEIVNGHTLQLKWIIATMIGVVPVGVAVVAWLLPQ